MKFEIETVEEIDAKAGDMVVSDSTVALICEDKQTGFFYLVNLTNGSLWSMKSMNIEKLIDNYFSKGNYTIYKSKEAKLILSKKGR